MGLFKEEISLIFDIEENIIQYSIILKNAAKIIEENLEKNTPIPDELKNILSEGEPYDRSWLKWAKNTIEACVETNTSSLKIIRDELSQAKVSNAIIWMIDWSSGMGRCLERVINEYKSSNILPPPHHHYSGMTQRIIAAFPSGKSQKLSHYLRTVENPWAKYATK